MLVPYKGRSIGIPNEDCMRNATLTVALALTAAACKPQSAVLTEGSYTAFFAEATSVSLSRGEVDLEGYDSYHQIDCRFFEDPAVGESLRLDQRLPICGAGDDGTEEFFSQDFTGNGILDIEDYDDDEDGVIDAADCDDKNPMVGAEGCEYGGGDGFWPPYDQYWLGSDGYHIVTEDLDPWRAEGVVTHEGDLLVTFHHKLPGGADFWFQFSVDRFFQPTECVEDDSGEVIVAALDGDWVDEWSKDLERIADLQDDEKAFAPYAHLEPFLDGGRMYYLNGRLVQYNPDPDNGNDQWYMPERWSAGAAQGQLAEELMVDFTPVTADPALLTLLAQGYYSYQFTNLESLLWYCPMEPGTDPTTNPCMISLEAEVDDRVAGSVADLDYVMRPSAEDDAEPENRFGPMRQMNFWRAVDGRPSGFDGWGEMYHSYVVFSGDSDLRIGGSAEGAFTIVLSAADSNSFAIVKGQFEIPKIRKDRWVPDNLRVEKREQAQEASDEPIVYCQKP